MNEITKDLMHAVCCEAYEKRCKLIARKEGWSEGQWSMTIPNFRLSGFSKDSNNLMYSLRNVDGVLASYRVVGYEDGIPKVKKWRDQRSVNYMIDKKPSTGEWLMAELERMSER